MTGVDCEALRALLAKATPGPWECGRGIQYEPVTTVYCDDSLGSAVATCRLQHTVAISREQQAANAALIAAAVNALPALLAKSDAYDALVARVEAAPVVEMRMRDDDRGNDWLECGDELNYASMSALDGQRIRLLVSDDRPSHTAGENDA